jgi:hypothetical protein
MFHIDDQGTDLFKFLAGFETAVTSTRGVLGVEALSPDLLDFLEGKLDADAVRELVKIVSRPDDKNLALLHSIGFRERVVGQHDYFIHDLPEWRVVYDKDPE